ncbi:hypothetical protein H310_13424 [Aphanomyces invadans]|uniref:Splicing factor Cactin n=1 Tax=Aphanomyces invadans TaxID=157072 RepID=A0A024TFN8_9STRA|nr:hypothetical protein H310_13424 [Aphanomyces invadans]ETV92177.1 hypothetical protein H310_13424 [Aphanomyces invadans]|eukprot:XP_008879141.1 hypothetical protein H310_13424 [Aphanomyces invadans]
MGKSSKSKRRASSSDESDSDDERRRRRREKKKSKKASKIVKEMGYSNEQNPFNDANLTEKFVWHKNKNRPTSSTSKSSLSKRRKGGESDEDKREELVREIMKVRRRRDERDAEREEMERLKNEEMRLRDASQYEDWQKKEEDFHLSQARVRSHIRIREGREKPIDLLAKNLMLASLSAVAMIDPTKELTETLAELKHAHVELRPPEELLADLDVRALIELKDEIAEYMDLEGRTGEHFTFWKLLHVICQHEIQRQQRRKSGRGAIHRDVEASITEMLQDKSTAELDELKHEIEGTLAGHDKSGIDVEYYENVLAEIVVQQAKVELRAIHATLLQRLADRVQEQEANAVHAAARKAAAAAGPADEDEIELSEKAKAKQLLDEEFLVDDDSREALAMWTAEMNKGNDDAETQFIDQVDVAAKTLRLAAWSQKYRPRKPRFFNRVKTGYDWNKYNQTHYDGEDSAPPKIVQGYKFNLFYPDLIDKHTTPKYTFEAIPGTTELCILRFSAGPPYVDIAFKVVNQEWEFSHKRGFKCVFDRGVLQLHFTFKRHRYRR